MASKQYVDHTLPVKQQFDQYLTFMAIDEFNAQRRVNLDPADFDMRRLHNNGTSIIAYELRDYVMDRRLRFRIYLDIGSTSTIGNFTAMLDDSFQEGAYGDEIMTAHGTLDVEGIRLLGYNVKAWYIDHEHTDILMQERTDAILLEDGGFIHVESAP